LEEVDADHIAALVVIERVDEVVNLAASVGNGMVGFQQIVGVVVELYLVDSVVGIEAVEEIILCCGCAAGEQDKDNQEEVFKGFHDTMLLDEFGNKNRNNIRITSFLIFYFCLCNNSAQVFVFYALVTLGFVYLKNYLCSEYNTDFL
jgi:hypothetical protein